MDRTGDTEAPAESVDPGEVADVEMTVALDAAELPAFLLRNIVVTLRVPIGQHLYGPPVSDGLVITSVEIEENKHIGIQAPEFPPAHPMVLRGTGETLQVYEGDVQIRVPILYNASRLKLNEDGSLTVNVTGTVRWQSCDEDACHLPRSEQFSLTIPVRGPNVPGMLSDAARDANPPPA